LRTIAPSSRTSCGCEWGIAHKVAFQSAGIEVPVTAIISHPSSGCCMAVANGPSDICMHVSECSAQGL
jgi:hypothetical protein